MTKRKCGQIPSPERLARIRAAIAELNPDKMADHRYETCVHASGQRRACRRLVKAYGRTLVLCMDTETKNGISLYSALRDPDFKCPEGRF